MKKEFLEISGNLKIYSEKKINKNFILDIFYYLLIKNQILKWFFKKKVIDLKNHQKSNDPLLLTEDLFMSSFLLYSYFY